MAEALDSAQEVYEGALKSFDEAFHSLGVVTKETVKRFQPDVDKLAEALENFRELLESRPRKDWTGKQSNLQWSFHGVLGEIKIAQTVIKNGILYKWSVCYLEDAVRVYNEKGHLLHFNYDKASNKLEWVITNDSYPLNLPEPSYELLDTKWIRGA
ncbi:hypothetical protein TSTA_108330 [Talaromyces stipitatus ATCC 10500]|uniref:Uncharacterized protein n=1 Tax=Talaromyces stipitatus (strain ATCC 10500 / CBS 375.48 / QM 6759 / NRRL 1006) TaxID=441959 RepID=B8MUE1_TALSN|nr:uncharacterized protein TSTA_108330 [Talaromyces stipitatus ATCC 10500]EED11645.1 hypothetical protein TSTA_108330 [Talaromyces stipitatus ATCC 10500]